MAFFSGLGTLSGLLGLGGGISGLLGSIDAKRAAAAAAAAREQAAKDYSNSVYNQYYKNLFRARTNLSDTGGELSDAISRLGGNLGVAADRAGIYNSTATTGLMNKNASDMATTLRKAYVDEQNNAENLLNSGLARVADIRQGIANADYANANTNLNYSRAGMSSYLNGLSQSDLFSGSDNKPKSAETANKVAGEAGSKALDSSGGNAIQGQLPRQLGGYGNKLPMTLNGVYVPPNLNPADSAYQYANMYNPSVPSYSMPYIYTYKAPK